MIQIAVVEDQTEERKRITGCLRHMSQAKGLELIISEFSSGVEFLGQYQPIYDIVLMDIEMPVMNGMDTARALREIDDSVILIFITNLAQYAVQGYEVDAMGYMLKPISDAEFAMKMSRAIVRTTKRNDGSIIIKTAHETHHARISSIRYAEVDGHYIVYHTTEGVYSEYSTMKQAESKLSQPYFVKCNRSFLLIFVLFPQSRTIRSMLGQTYCLYPDHRRKLFSMR